MRVRNALLIVVLVVIGMVATALPATADLTGEEGCAPGYWRNHTEDWLEAPGERSHDTDALFGDAFGVAYGNVTLLEALQGGGGRGIAGAHKILAGAATAAVINAASEDLGYPLRRTEILPAVQLVWNGTRHEILSLAKYLDRLNNYANRRLLPVSDTSS